MKNQITKQTIIRTVIMFVTLFNAILTHYGKNPLPFSEEEIYEFLSSVALIASTIWAWWKNNSFTSRAIEADKYLHQLRRNEVSEFGGDGIKFDEWVKQFLGKKLDPDRLYGVQCVDLIKHYCRYVLGMAKSYMDTWGNAIDWYNNYGKGGNWAYLEENFTMIKYKKGMKIQKGDIAVMKSKSEFGHIAVCTGTYDDDSFEAYDQNYNGTGAGMTKRTFGYTGTRTLMCVLRPKNQKNIAQDKVYKHTTANLRAYAKSDCKNATLIITKGTKVEFISSLTTEFKAQNGKKYKKSKIIYNGKTLYVASAFLK